MSHTSEKLTDLTPTRSFYLLCYCGCRAPATDVIKEVDGIVVNFATKVCHVRYMADHCWR